MSESKPPKSILIVESNLELRHLLNTALKRRNLLPEFARDGQDAVARCQNHPVDLVLVDLTALNSSQLPCIASVKTRLPKVPVIVVSAFSNLSDINRAFDLGADEFLAKPCPLESIVSRVESWVDGSRVRSAPEKTASEMQRGA